MPSATAAAQPASLAEMRAMLRDMQDETISLVSPALLALGLILLIVARHFPIPSQPGPARFLLRQFFLNLPRELKDAARIDGCSEFGIFSRIIMPLSKAVLAVVATFAFQGFEYFVQGIALTGIKG